MSHEAESAVLGSMIIDNNCISLVGEILTADMFYDLTNRKAFEGILRLSSSGVDIDGLQVKNLGIDAVTTLAIMESVPSSASVEYYAKIVIEDYKVFRLQALAHMITGIAGEDIPADDMISKVQETVTQHTDHEDLKVIDHVGDIAKTIEFKKDGSKRVPTGYKAIDDIIIGICDTDYVVVAGRPGMGKTALMVDIATKISWNRGIPVSFYTCEMSKEQLVSRMASARSGVPLYNVEKGFASEDELDMLKEAARQMEKCPMYIKSTGGLTPMSLKRKISADKRKHGIQMAFVDYLQLMQPDGGSRSQYEDITRISRSIKQVILQTGVPIVMGSQLKRIEEAKRPTLTDFRGSGAIEEDTDIIIGLHREFYYDPEKPPDGAEALVLKGRHYGTGIAELSFTGNLTHFTDRVWI